MASMVMQLDWNCILSELGLSDERVAARLRLSYENNEIFLTM